MRSLVEIDQRLSADDADAAALLALGEDILANWLVAHGTTPTAATREGFRLLALHRQGARDDASFNACRETCRELVYHFNVLAAEPGGPASVQRLRMMRFVARHLFLFVSGKLEEAGLGEFCCASRPLRSTPEGVTA